MPQNRLALAAALVCSLLLAAPASALGSLDEARCICADSARNQGDYVSCISQFARRLLLLGVIDRVERSNAISDASNADLETILVDCADGGGNALDVDGWGVGLQVGSAFYPAPAPGVPDSAAELTLLLWNFSPEDVFQSTPTLPVGDCSVLVRIFNEVGQLVREDDSICLPVIARLDLPIGTVEQRPFVLPLLAFQSENGLGDGTPLPTGAYKIEVTLAANGPSQDEMPSTAGARPSASITIRVGS